MILTLAGLLMRPPIQQIAVRPQSQAIATDSVMMTLVPSTSFKKAMIRNRRLKALLLPQQVQTNGQSQRNPLRADGGGDI